MEIDIDLLNIKKESQCVHTIALVCSPKIGNDRQPWKALNKLTKISYPVKIWELFINKMRSIIYSRVFIGSLFELSPWINLSVLCSSCFAQYLPE